MKNYDVWFNLSHPANIVIEARSEEEAKDIAEEMLVNMDRSELLDRIVAALDYQGVEVVDVENIIEP